MIVRHHEKYLEIDGEDKIILMEQSEHHKLHKARIKNGMAKIPLEVLMKAHNRLKKETKEFKQISILESVKKRMDSMKAQGQSYNGFISEMLDGHEEKTRGE